MYKPKSIFLKDIPEDIYDEIQRVQYEEKKKRKTQYSLVQAVFKIIKESKKNKS